jgi:hypothetical protein
VSLALAPLYTTRIELAPILELGATPFGTRRIIDILGGRFEGARLKGEVLPGGADWQIVRPDGVARAEARYTLRTGDGALIHVRNVGYRHGPPEVIARIARGEEVDPAEYYFRTTPRFETGAARYAWLNRVVALATGARRRDAVEFDVYEVL